MNDPVSSELGRWGPPHVFFCPPPVCTGMNVCTHMYTLAYTTQVHKMKEMYLFLAAPDRLGTEA